MFDDDDLLTETLVRQSAHCAFSSLSMPRIAIVVHIDDLFRGLAAIPLRLGRLASD